MSLSPFTRLHSSIEVKVKVVVVVEMAVDAEVVPVVAVAVAPVDVAVVVEATVNDEHHILRNEGTRRYDLHVIVSGLGAT